MRFFFFFRSKDCLLFAFCVPIVHLALQENQLEAFLKCRLDTGNPSVPTSIPDWFILNVFTFSDRGRCFFDTELSFLIRRDSDLSSINDLQLGAEAVNVISRCFIKGIWLSFRPKRIPVGLGMRLYKRECSLHSVVDSWFRVSVALELCSKDSHHNWQEKLRTQRMTAKQETMVQTGVWGLNLKNPWLGQTDSILGVSI